MDAWVVEGEVSFKVGQGSAEVLSIAEGIEPVIATSKRLGRSVDVRYGDEAVYFKVG